MAKLTLQETMDRLWLLIRAGYPVIYIVSHEEARVLDYLAKIYRVIKAEQPGKHFLRWYEGIGLEEVPNLAAHAAQTGQLGWLELDGLPQTINVVGQIANAPAEKAVNSIATAGMNYPALANSLTVFFDLHQYLRQDGGGGWLVRPVRNAADKIRQFYDANRHEPGRPYKTIIIIAPSAANLSSELERDLIVIDFPLPEEDELKKALNGMIDRNILSFPAPVPREELLAVCGSEVTQSEYESRLRDLIAGAGRGLTLEDYRLGLNMFAVRHEALCARHIEDLLHLKATAINNQALQYTPHVNIELGGLKGIRTWVNVRRDAAVSSEVRARYHLPPPRGVMLCGVSGGGKSQLAKLIAKEFNLALLRLDVGALFGMYVGESEERTRVALQLAEVLAPVVLWLDEVDKAFSGMGQGGDNGVSARVFGHFLTWLAEKQDSVFVVATANDFKVLLDKFPEFGRKGRFDEIFWVRLPDMTARRAIFRIYLEPHLKSGHFLITDEIFEELRRRQAGILNEPEGATPFERFCWLLGHGEISNNMTGAEIEYAIIDALYEAYEQDRGINSRDKFTPDLIVNTVKKAKDRALYRPGSPDQIHLADLQAEATAKNWIMAE